MTRLDDFVGCGVADPFEFHQLRVVRRVDVNEFRLADIGAPSDAALAAGAAAAIFDASAFCAWALPDSARIMAVRIRLSHFMAYFLV
jgi:hypothetical protein